MDKRLHCGILLKCKITQLTAAAPFVMRRNILRKKHRKIDANVSNLTTHYRKYIEEFF